MKNKISFKKYLLEKKKHKKKKKKISSMFARNAIVPAGFVYGWDTDGSGDVSGD